MWKPFLEITDEEVQTTTNTNVIGSFAFAKAAILAFQQNGLSDVNERDEGTGKKGTLIFTGATASWRGNVTTSLFSAGKFALRSFSQSLNKEFGKQNIHVAHVSFCILVYTGADFFFAVDYRWGCVDR